MIRIHRKGYHRKGYRRRDGTYVRPTYVRPSTFLRKDIGRKGKGGPVIIKVKKGKLKRFGYSTSASASSRHEALRKAIRAYGKNKVWRMLHIQTIYRKRLPDHAKSVFREDRDWITRTFGGPVPRQAIRKWKRMSPRARAKAMPGGRI